MSEEARDERVRSSASRRLLQGALRGFHGRAVLPARRGHPVAQIEQLPIRMAPARGRPERQYVGPQRALSVLTYRAAWAESRTGTFCVIFGSDTCFFSGLSRRRIVWGERSSVFLTSGRTGPARCLACAGEPGLHEVGERESGTVSLASRRCWVGSLRLSRFVQIDRLIPVCFSRTRFGVLVTSKMARLDR